MSKRNAYTFRMSNEEQRKLTPLIEAAARVMQISRHEFITKAILTALIRLDEKLKEIRKREDLERDAEGNSNEVQFEGDSNSNTLGNAP